MASGEKGPALGLSPPTQPMNEFPMIQEKVGTDASSPPDPATSEKDEKTVKPEEKSKGGFKDYLVSLANRASFIEQTIELI